MKYIRPRWKPKPSGGKRPDGFYQSKPWRRVRAAYIMHQSGICEGCGSEPRESRGLHVDHITPLNQGGDPYSFDNLQVLCASCHGKKTVREGNAPAWMQAKAKAKDERREQQRGEGG